MLHVVLSLLLVVPGMMGNTVGYLGKSVNLSSESNSTLKIIKIEWSIFSNPTWIATYKDNVINTNRLQQFENRLRLNSSTGDLEIRDLKKTDEMEYSVLIKYDTETQHNNKVKLIVTGKDINYNHYSY
ncbi:hypothetical protein DPEC_G00095540 [Dallia pectoralis]|uniref:Uncharacterized protein n=1 Tax=Dallia pectoralis TaxID=75939 RepID=A0ACC2GW98_DALPE|nr:hypothetical protein DPEC_G00095540 [Dallia pectoralis]